MEMILYNIFIKIYGSGILLASFFNNKAELWVEGRRNIFRNIEKIIKKEEAKIWFHCASLGEFEQGLPLMERIKKIYPEYKLVVTFFSPSGYNIRHNHHVIDYCFYLPLDTKKNAIRFIELINPRLVFFIKYEFWFNFLNTLYQKNIPVLLVSAIFHPDQMFFKFYGKFFIKFLKQIDYFFVQDNQSLKLLQSLGVSNAAISGDTRFDRVWVTKLNIKPLPIIEQFKGNHKLLIAGSSWKPEELILLQFIEKKLIDIKYIIAPHEISVSKINTLISYFEKLNIKVVRFSEIDEANANAATVLIIDNIGILSSLYSYADFALIGGGFGKGIHNILEAAVFGMPIFFGPNYKNFPEATDLIELPGAHTIENYQNFEGILMNYLNNPKDLNRSSSITRSYVENKRGATDIIMKHIDDKNYLKK